MGGGAWPFLVGGVICLVNSVNERDLDLLNSPASALVVLDLGALLPLGGPVLPPSAARKSQRGTGGAGLPFRAGGGASLRLLRGTIGG